jgi:RNA recognition motif-containing protein
MNIYVGNLSYNITGEDLRQAFTAFGQVATASVIRDQSSGRSKGFGFVEMPATEEGRAAIAGMDGKTMDNRALKVNEARSRDNNRRDGGKRRQGGRARY